MSNIVPITNQSGTIRISDYQGQPVLSLRADTKWPFSFGLKKAEVILEHIAEIEAFVASGGETFLPEKKAKKANGKD